MPVRLLSCLGGVNELSLSGVIRIRPGQSWRLNPAYVGELRALRGARAKGFTGSDILDVLGIEVDGVDIAAGVGEARVLQAIDELAQALIRIDEGQPAAQATIGPGPTELVLEARGHDLLLTLVTLAPPARVLASGLLVDGQKMRAATLHAARGLLLDLLAISPALSAARLARRLGAECAELARSRHRPGLPRPPRDTEPRTLLSHVQRKPEKLSIQLPPETMARLLAAGEVPFAPLAAHLGRGSITLLRSAAPGLTWEGPVFLFLRNLLADAERLIEAWEGGEPAFLLQFGTHELRWDLTADEVRAQGWKRPLKLPPLRLAKIAAGAAELYAEETLRHGSDELAADLRERARALLTHCTDLETGDLRRAPAIVAAPPPQEAREKRAPLARGRIRRLIYREIWRKPAAAALRVVPLQQGRLLLESGEQLRALDLLTGEETWRVRAAPGAVRRGCEVFYAEPADALVRLDALSGEPRWKRRLRGARHPARLWPLSAGVLRGLPGEGLALVEDSGALGFRARLPGGAPHHVVAVSGVLVVALSSGSLAGLDAADGRVLWKRRLRARALLACGAGALAVSGETLSRIDPQTGKTEWEREIPPDATDAEVHDGAVSVVAGGAVWTFSVAGGERRSRFELGWAQQLLSDEDGALIALGPGGAAMRLDGRKRWSIEGAGDAPASGHLRRGVLLLQRGPTELYDAYDGLLVAQLPAARAAALGDDLCCALLQDDAVSLHKLTTHLSVI
jgi:hypothetical protein